jgi:hypothetical protein
MSKKPPQAPGSPAAPPTKRKGKTKGKPSPRAPSAAATPPKPAPKPKPGPKRALTLVASKQTLETKPKSVSTPPNSASAPGTDTQEPKTAARLTREQTIATHQQAMIEVGLLPNPTSASIPAPARKKKFQKPDVRYSRELVDRICSEIAHGGLLNEICEQPGMPHASTFRMWVINDVDGLYTRHIHAREAWAHFHAEEIVRLSDQCRVGIKVKTDANGVEVTTADSVERTRIQIDARKFLVARFARKTYGDAVQVEGGMTLTLAAQLRQLEQQDIPQHAALPQLPPGALE